jgi:hypothetical protein
MSRWAETFAALSRGPDTLDTMRRSDGPPSTVSQSVKSVTARAPPEPTPAPVDYALAVWGEPEGERAAVIEYDGGAPRAWAEALALLDPNKPPSDVPARRWLCFIDDCGCFIDCGWAERATSLGWGPLDLFGCDRERPFGRVDHMGLLWLLDGREIIELHRDRATIETPSGARQVYRRRPVEVGRVVLAWELSV